MTDRINARTLSATLVAVGLLGSAVAAPASAKKIAAVGPGGAVPDATGSMPVVQGALTTTVRIGNKAKGRKIRDVNVTLQGTGSGPNSAANLRAILTAPSGSTTRLMAGNLSGQSFGPLKFDDESTLFPCTPGVPFATPSCLYPPYAGSVQPLGFLGSLDNARAKGTWTLRVFDFMSGNGTTTLGPWTLEVNAGKPYRTK